MVLAGFLYMRLGWKFDAERRLDAIRAADLPASPSELDVWYAAVPTAENAALVVLDAAAQVREPPQRK